VVNPAGGVVADLHATHGGDILGADVARPLLGGLDFCVVDTEPAAELVEVEPEVVPAFQRGSAAPPLDPLGPGGGDTFVDALVRPIPRGMRDRQWCDEDAVEGQGFGELEVQRSLCWSGGSARLRRDSDRNSGPRFRDRSRRRARYAASSTPVVSE